MIPKSVRVFALLVICGLFAVSLYAAVVASQPLEAGAQPSQPTGTNQFAILVTTIAGFASLLATQLFQFYRENRNRRWDLADREAARSEMRRSVEAQRFDTIQTAIELARVSNINREHLQGAIERNTAITSEAGSKAEAAFREANNFNTKLEALHRELQRLQRAAAEPVPKPIDGSDEREPIL